MKRLPVGSEAVSGVPWESKGFYDKCVELVDFLAKQRLKFPPGQGPTITLAPKALGASIGLSLIHILTLPTILLV